MGKDKGELSAKEAARFLGVSLEEFSRSGPQPTKKGAIGGKRWSIADLDWYRRTKTYTETFGTR